MWLINTTTLKLKFFLTPPPRYSILSHVWTDEECSFQEFRSLEDVDEPILAITEKKGFKKIQACCKLSLEQNFEWTWVDTCCIDKRSSAELSESINSMFSWYQSSASCYAYLDDVESTSTTKKDILNQNPSRPAGWSTVPSAWYSRGWTLQELIAPLKVEFYNRYWSRIGSKWGLRGEISSITGVSEADLVVFDPRRSSIAQKMSWASRRKTTRVEDEAYCLLGLFGVHMPLLYGEGTNAFRRLQEELIRTSTDHTIFAWGPRLDHPPWDTFLAPSPSYFEEANFVVSRVWRLGNGQDRHAAIKSYAITNRGLEIELPILCDLKATRDYLSATFISQRRITRCTIGLLNCEDTREPGVALGLVLVAKQLDTFSAAGPVTLKNLNDKFEARPVVFPLDQPTGCASSLRRVHLEVVDIGTPGPFGGGLIRYAAQIFVAKELVLESVYRVPGPKSFDDASAAATHFLAPKRDQIINKLENESSKVEITADGCYGFRVPYGHSFDSLVLNLSTDHPWTVFLQLLLSPLASAEQALRASSDYYRHREMVKGLTCRVWETGPGGNKCTSYRREVSGRSAEERVWIHHAMLNGRELEVSVVGMSTKIPGSDFAAELLYFGLTEA